MSKGVKEVTEKDKVEYGEQAYILLYDDFFRINYENGDGYEDLLW
jgi:hypothetical protein